MECRIRITDGINSNGFKELSALAIEEFLDNSVGKFWSTDNIKNDINSEHIAEYLNSVFPDESPWEVNGSQQPFDMYSLKARVAIELKSNKTIKNKNSKNSKYIIANATIYPTQARVRDVVPGNRWDKEWSDAYLNSMLDVLVVVTNKVNDKLLSFCIVDGSYWGVDIEDFISCRAFFSDINNDAIMTEILRVIIKHNPNQLFAKKILNGDYKDKIMLSLRKLIQVSNPIEAVSVGA
jgi:hypothetical protein